MRIANMLGAGIVLLLCGNTAFSQQLKLGKNPYVVEKSAVLELNSDNQGLLLARIADTTQINTLSPPDGMVIYFTPAKQLMVRSNGSWKSLTLGTAISSLNGLTASTQTFATGATGTDFNISSSGSTHTFNIPDAGASARGLVTTGAQTFAGAKTFAPLQVVGSNPLTLTGVQLGTSTTADSLLTITNGLVRKLPMSTFTSSGTSWTLNGNTVGSQKNFGTIDNFDLPFLTNNTERMRLSATGNLGIGSSSFNATNPEKLLVQAGTTTSFNLMQGHGKINSYLQLNIQNDSAGTAASSDLVATANNGDEAVNFVDMGINSSANTSTGVIGGANNAYLYSTGNDFSIGNSTAGKSLLLFTGGTAAANERMRIDGNGKVGIGTTSPSTALHIFGTNPLTLTGVQTGTSTSADSLLTITSGLVRKLPMSTFSSASNSWSLNGNTVGSLKNFGTIDNFDLPFIANNTERMRLSASGNLGIGSTSFNGTNPEKLLVQAGTTTSFNLMQGHGKINSYLQLNIQNDSAGTAASSDLVATANNGDEAVNFVDLGINSSANTSTGVIGGANNAYLYSTGNDFSIGNSTAGKSLLFFTGGTASANERMRIDGNGNVGIGTTSPSTALHVVGTNPLTLTGVQPGTSTSADSLLTITSGLVRKLPMSTFASASNFWTLNGNTVGSLKNFGTIDNFDLPFITNNTEKMRLTATGNLGIGAATFNGANPEKLLVQAGTTTSVNLMQGHGKINSYLQLNIQNDSAGTSASSDVVATSDNGNETVNFVDMGINSSANTSSGILSGANNAYLYSTGNDFVIGNATALKSLLFFTGGTATGNERMRIDSSGKVGIQTNAPASTLDVNGSFAAAIVTTQTNITLDATNYTVILTNSTPVVTLPAASTCARRMYVIVNQTPLPRTISTYKDFSGSNATTVLSNSSMTVQSDGTNWYRIR